MGHQDLIQRIQEGDQEALSQLLRHAAPLLRYVIAPILSDEREREECLSDIALKLWKGTFDPDKGSWNSYLTAVARNAALNRLRAAKRHAAAPLTPEIPSPQPTPEEEVLQAERRQALQEALDRLSDQDRALFYRKYYYRQPLSQMAAELGMTERAVEGKLYRIRKRLQQQLGGDRHD